MALPSQGGFSSTRRGSMYRRKRGRRTFSWFIVFVAGAGITWMLWPTGARDDALEEVAETTPVIEVKSIAIILSFKRLSQGV